MTRVTVGDVDIRRRGHIATICAAFLTAKLASRIVTGGSSSCKGCQRHGVKSCFRPTRKVSVVRLGYTTAMVTALTALHRDLNIRIRVLKQTICDVLKSQPQQSPCIPQGGIAIPRLSWMTGIPCEVPTAGRPAWTAGMMRRSPCKWPEKSSDEVPCLGLATGVRSEILPVARSICDRRFPWQK